MSSSMDAAVAWERSGSTRDVLNFLSRRALKRAVKSTSSLSSEPRRSSMDEKNRLRECSRKLDVDRSEVKKSSGANFNCRCRTAVAFKKNLLRDIRAVRHWHSMATSDFHWSNPSKRWPYMKTQNDSWSSPSNMFSSFWNDVSMKCWRKWDLSRLHSESEAPQSPGCLTCLGTRWNLYIHGPEVGGFVRLMGLGATDALTKPHCEADSEARRGGDMW
mmetsp:Transcript_48379/g.121790  ORF Transcript_48379/g.121790 Transcript_48379/m.121790 type:complete len:217 (+) Transcript_48379:263-913(+)